ncbi:protein phosphatase 1 regulatory subunit 1C isoform X2 [Trichomycterus rosablanca]|uniref:protein phosphatase 1 regulatory subunit 1C isoform X2 n=1 Tax=Trichomycterus rosablanca TaxID=2290929 RepID=UPI002F3544CA
MEPNSPKKIQFAVPLFQSHLDPQAAEHIRKRRPTPATLVIYNDPNASDDRQSSSSQGENPVSPAQRKTSVYTPPTMRELQLVVEQHFQRQEQTDAVHCDSPDTPSPVTSQHHHDDMAQWTNHSRSESFVSSDGQAGSSEEGGKDHSSTQRSSQEDSPNTSKLSHSHLDTLSEETTDKDSLDQMIKTRVKINSQMEEEEEEEEENFCEDGETQKK